MKKGSLVSLLLLRNSSNKKAQGKLSLVVLFFLLTLSTLFVVAIDNVSIENDTTPFFEANSTFENITLDINQTETPPPINETAQNTTQEITLTNSTQNNSQPPQETTDDTTYTLQNQEGETLGSLEQSGSEDHYSFVAFEDEQEAGVQSSNKLALEIYGLEQPEEFKAFFDDNTQSIPSVSVRSKILAINDINIEKAVIFLPTTGNVDTILHCENFNFETKTCENWETTDISFEVIDNRVIFEVEHFSGYAAGEIVAIDAEHLDSDYSFISNIFDDIEFQDDIWAEPIYAEEVVRVTFEEDLTDGRFIDIYAESNDTLTYFEVYEAGTDNLVGTSSPIDFLELQYIEVTGLTEPTSIFDFKVKRVLNEVEETQMCLDWCSIGCLEDPYDLCDFDCLNDCHDVTVIEDREAYIIFDFIHDDAINAVQADGVFVYEARNTGPPNYRTWSEANALSSELTDMVDVGDNDITWNVIRAARTRDEMIVGTEDKQLDLNIQVLDGTGTWGNLLEVSSDLVNSAYRAFDIAYEDGSGDALIVYETSSSVDNTIAYRTWDGTSYSGESTLTLGFTDTTTITNWISLVPRNNKTDDIMLLVHNDAGGLYGIAWDGTSFDTDTELEFSTATTSNLEQHFTYSWETASGGGLVGYGEGNNYVYRTYSPTAPHWSTEATIDLSHSVDAIRSCSDQTSDHIGVIWQDSGNDVQARVWDGTDFLASPPSEDTTTEANGADNANVDCTWYADNAAIFGFVDNNALSVDYFFFNKSNTWSTAALTSTSNTGNIGGDDIKGLSFSKKHPTTGEVMLVIQDTVEDVGIIRWTGDSMATISASPVEGLTEVGNGGQESAMFAWYRYDPAPNVTTLLPASGSFSPGYVVEINATIRDNLGVSGVLVNVTLPNGSINQQTMTDGNADAQYNATFSTTSDAGTYTIRIVANDTKDNKNTSITSSFTIAETAAPDVNSTSPSNATYNVSNNILIAANVTDGTNVSVVLANITLGNNSKEQVTLSFIGGFRYSYSYTIPPTTGNYNITFIANDTSGNKNTSVRVHFTVNDVVAPGVNSTSPANGTSFNEGTSMTIAANMSDDVNMSAVFANITLGNNSIERVNLDYIGGTRYSATYNIPKVIGIYNVTFIANDTSGNRNTTEKRVFTVNDITYPTVNNTFPLNDTTYNVSNAIQIAANFSDEINISTITANITLGNNSKNFIVLSFVGGMKYNASYTIPASFGQYNITFVANDTSGNKNASQRITFTVNDIINPTVNSTQPGNVTYNVSNVIQIAANITDDVNISNILANITLGNNSIQQVTLLYAGGERYNYTFQIPPVIGKYNVTFLANDTSGNKNSSKTIFFTVNDILAPGVNSTSPGNATYNVSNVITVAVNVSDDVNVTTVLANVTLGNNTIQQISLAYIGGTRYSNATYTIPNAIGNYNITFLATDTSGNRNTTERVFFTVNDIIAPQVAIQQPPADSSYLADANVPVEALVTDSIAISAVYASVTQPNGSIVNSTMTDGNSDGVYNVTYSLTSQTGAYKIRYVANDSGNNINFTQTRNFTIQDSGVPLVTLFVPGDDKFINYTQVSFNCNASDATGLSNFTLYHNMSGSFIANQTNSTSGVGNDTNFTIPTVAQGSYIWNCRSTDTANNNATASSNYTFTVDTTTPTATGITKDPSIPYYSNLSSTELKLNFSSSEFPINITFRLYNATGTINTSGPIQLNSVSDLPINYTIPPAVGDGNYSLNFTIQDKAGNANITSIGTVVVDTTKPYSTALSISPNLPYYSNGSNLEVEVNFSASEFGTNVSFTLYNSSGVIVNTTSGTKISGTSNLPINFTIPSSLSQGNFTLNMTLEDLSGNKNTTQLGTIVFDSVKPISTALVITPTIPYFNNGSAENITVNFTADTLPVNVTFTIYNSSGTAINTTTPIRVGTVSNLPVNFSLPTLAEGNYTINMTLEDAAGNVNSTTFGQIEVDTTVPAVFDVIPQVSSSFSVSQAIEIGVNITDNIPLGTTRANVTLPNGSTNEFAITLVGSTNKYNTSFTIPVLTGNYNVTFFANDSLNHTNNSVKTNFSVADASAPSIIGLGCSNDNTNLTKATQCNTTVTDNFDSISSVIANITFPNGTIEVQTITNSSSNYNFNFTNTIAVGQYKINWWVNDSNGNVNTTNDYFNISDVTSPNITLHAPANNSNWSRNSASFNFSAVDNHNIDLNCSLTLDGIVNITNLKVPSTRANTTFNITGLQNRQHTWNITCLDNSSNSNISINQIFTIDTLAPHFESLTTSPDTADRLDPGKFVTLKANITENLTQISTVIIQYKLSNTSYYTNLTAAFDTFGQIYNASFNATENGTYYARIFANDTLGNGDFSNLINFTVQKEATWTRDPVSFPAVAADISTNISIGNLTINNTGDYVLNFSITSSSNQTHFNTSANFSLAAGAVKYISINDTGSTGGAKAITFNISAQPNSTAIVNASPQSQISTASVVSAPGQPVLVSTFTTPSTETLAATQGDTGVAFTANLENVGPGNASNVSFFLTIPNNWTLTFGSLKTNISDEDMLTGSDSTELAIELTVPADATPGAYTIYANASGMQTNGTNLTLVNLIFGDAVTVNVAASIPDVLGTPEAPTSSGSSETPSSSESGGAADSVLVKRGSPGGNSQTIVSREEFFVTRGSGESTPLEITNLYVGTVMTDIDLIADGFLAQYVVIGTPIDFNKKQEVVLEKLEQEQITINEEIHTITLNDIQGSLASLTIESDPIEFDIKVGKVRYIDIDEDLLADIAVKLNKVSSSAELVIYELKDEKSLELAHGETVVYGLDIFAPDYLVQSDFNLGLKIFANVAPTEKRNTKTRVSEYRDLVFKVLEVDEEGATNAIAISEQDIQDMKDAGFNTNQVEEIFNNALIELSNDNYKSVSLLTDQIHEIRILAFETNELILKIEGFILESQEKLLEVPGTQEEIDLAKVAFERGDYKTALERAKAAELIYVLESRGRINLIWLLTNYWWAFLIGALVAIISGYLLYRTIIIGILNQRIRDINKEETSLESLLKEAQKEYLVEGTLSSTQYKKRVAQYEKRLTKIRQLRLKLRNKRVAIIRTSQELKNIKAEKKEIIKLIEKGQKDYFIKAKVGRNKFLDSSKLNKERLAEIEQEEEILEEKLRRQTRRRIFFKKKSVTKKKLKKKKQKKRRKKWKELPLLK
jgi:hypothetical protein